MEIKEKINFIIELEKTIYPLGCNSIFGKTIKVVNDTYNIVDINKLAYWSFCSDALKELTKKDGNYNNLLDNSIKILKKLKEIEANNGYADITLDDFLKLL